MADPTIWVSTIGGIDFDADGPGKQWELVGTIDSAQETELWKHIQAQIGLRASGPRIDGFYLHGSPSSSWVLRALDNPVEIGSFWLAIDPLGDGTQYLVTAEQATLGTLARRPPESHPALRERAVTLGIRLWSRQHRCLDLHRHDR